MKNTVRLYGFPMSKPSDSIQVIVYAHKRKEDGKYTYVGASTNFAVRWPGSTQADLVVLERTTLGQQVERESYWIKKLRSEGNPLSNRQKPVRIKSARIDRVDSGEEPSKKKYSYEYPRPSVTVDAVIFGVDSSSLKILLIRRANAPFKGSWAIPGGFVNMGEDLDTAARRELEEETSVSCSYLEQLRTFGDPKRDPRGRVISVAYFALARTDEMEPEARSDAKEVGWFSLNDLPNLAFDHRDIIDHAVKRMLAKVRYEPIGFDLLPESFTLADLQALYEKLLGRKLDKRNFRKKIMGMDGLLVDTGKKVRTVPPSRLYRFDKIAYARLRELGFNFEL
jgi:8-oxo-dGTP diphosphatase